MLCQAVRSPTEVKYCTLWNTSSELKKAIFRLLEGLCNSYTMAVRDFAGIYTLTPWACGPWGSGVYIVTLHTHLIRETTTDHSPHCFYRPAFDDRLWFQ